MSFCFQSSIGFDTLGGAWFWRVEFIDCRFHPVRFNFLSVNYYLQVVFLSYSILFYFLPSPPFSPSALMIDTRI